MLDTHVYRAGDALLEGLSPGEFALRATIVDRAVGLALDPSCLTGIAAALEALCGSAQDDSLRRGN